MNTEAGIWFIAGIIVGFVSMRALGWLCVVGLILCCTSNTGWAAATCVATVNNTTASTVSIQLGVDGTSSAAANAALYPGCTTVTLPCPPGVNTYTVCNTYNGTDSAWVACGGGPWQNVGVWPLNATISAGCVAAAYTPPPTYQFNGACITNNSTGILGFYAHLSTPVGGAQDYYSGPLAPKGYWCLPALTNSSPFTLEWEKVYYNSDGGTNAIDQFPPIWAGTNSPPPVQGGGVTGGPPGGSNPIQGGGAGQGSNTNLTGGQFQFGLSNLAVVIYDGNQLEAGLLQGIWKTLQTNSSGGQPNLQTNIDYSGYLRTLTNDAGVSTNLQGAMQATLQGLSDLAQGSNGFLLSATNASAISNASFLESLSYSNQFYTSSLAGVVGTANITNHAQLQSGDPTVWQIPWRTNVLDAQSGTTGYWNLDPTGTTLWTQITPWVRLVFTFFIVSLSVWYVQTQIGEALKRVELVPGCGPLKAGFAGFFGWLMSIGVTAVAIASIPILLGAAISTLYSFSGGAPFSPFSDAGAANAGSYAGSVRLGLYVLAQVFPFDLATAIVLYLTVFTLFADSTVLFAMRLVRRMS